MHDTKFANPKLAEIAESFYVRPGNVWASIGKELLAYLAMAIGVCVLGPVMMACFSVPSALFGVLANVIVMEPYKYQLFVAVICSTSAGYVCYSIIGNYFFKMRRKAKAIRINAGDALFLINLVR